MEGNRLGDGKTSPFGNGKGATAGGASSGANDFTKNPRGTGDKGGGNNFLTNPTGNAIKAGGRDFSKEKGGQTTKQAPYDINQESRKNPPLIHKDAQPGYGDIGSGSMGKPGKPFKLNK